ncbi:MAG: HU family DNA-binding protein [Chloroflexota bacterium]
MILPTLTKQRLARAVGRRTRLTNQQAASALEAVIAIVSEQLAAGGRVELANFLTLEVQAYPRLATESNFWHTSPSSESGEVTSFVLRCRPGKRLRAHLRTLSAANRRRP